MRKDKVNILLVDDNTPNLVALESILASQLLSIHKASSGQHALEMMLYYEYAIVLLDVNMPDMDGFEVAKLMKARKETRYLPICFVTAINKEQCYVDQGYQVGAVDYLYKPLDTETVRSKVNVFVELYHLRKESENRLNMIKSASDGIAILDGNLSFSFVNPALLSITGFEESALISYPFNTVLDQNSAATLLKHIETGEFCEGNWHGELQCQPHEGRSFPIDISLSRQDSGYVCLIRDISQQREAAAQMKMLESVVENANDMVVITGPDLNTPHGPEIRYVNPAFERITGYDKSEVIGQSPRILQGSNTDRNQVNQLKARLDKGLDGHMEVANYTKQGNEYYNDIRIIPIKNKLGHTEYFTSIQRDTTNRKLMEDELKRINKELETFTYITSHDMRAPILNLKGFCSELEHNLKKLKPVIELGLEQCKESDQVKFKKTVEKYIPASLNFIKQGAEKLDLLTGLLLELSRTGRRILTFKPLDSRTIVHHCLDTLNHQIQTLNIQVTVLDLPDIVADYAAMEQIFGNILDNAIKYLSTDRVGEITVGGFSNPQEATFFIRDNGCGIPKDQQHKVFEIFRRVGDVSEIPGEGMGIAFVKTLLHRHKGEIWCESTPGEGSTFYFTISNHLNNALPCEGAA